MAVGDVNGDKIDDVFFGGTKAKSGQVFIQTVAGDWVEGNQKSFMKFKSEVTDAVFFDADKDGDLDLVTVSGGQEEFDPEVLKPRLYINDGHGRFEISLNALGNVILNGSCVSSFDYDQDGDLDLFLGASVMPRLYGMSPMSFLLENNGGVFKPNLRWLGNSQFDNPTKVRPGMIKDAVWTKVNQDDLVDLIVVGEWMPITILIQQKDHSFINSTNEYSLQNTRGWWNTIESADFDHDGDDDWMVGNFGINSRLQVSPEKPVKMYLGDFDSNGGSDHILVYFNGEKSYPFASRDQLVKQIPSLKKRFLSYQDYRDVRLEDIVTPIQQGNSAIMQIDMLQSVYLENSNLGIALKYLPIESQMSPIFSICPADINNDGHLDVLIGGNLHNAQPDIGPYDASYGRVLIGDGKNGWNDVKPEVSGFIIKGDIKTIAPVRCNYGIAYFISINNNSIKGFRVKADVSITPP
jgi:enediyne biosynthesis protein E4